MLKINGVPKAPLKLVSILTWGNLDWFSYVKNDSKFPKMLLGLSFFFFSGNFFKFLAA